MLDLEEPKIVASEPSEKAVGPPCAVCGKRSLIRLARFDPDIPSRVYGCTRCRVVQLLTVRQGLKMVELYPKDQEQRALKMALENFGLTTCEKKG